MMPITAPVTASPMTPPEDNDADEDELELELVLLEVLLFLTQDFRLLLKE